MLKLVELAMAVKENGGIEIPIEAMLQMDIHIGDTIKLIYMAESEENLVNSAKEFVLARECENAEEALKKQEQIAFQIPQVLLEDAGISMDADLDIVCADGKIVILPAGGEGITEKIPPELMGIFQELGISRDKVNIILQTEGEGTDGKTNV